MAEGEIRIKGLEEITALTDNDYFVVDSSASGGETKKYKATNITDIIDNIPELVAEFEPNHYYDRDALVAHEGKVYYHNAPGASYEEFPTGYQFIQIDLTGLLSRLGFGISIQHNSSFTYNKGDYCMEDYILYRCLNDNVTGAWSSSDWERASLGYDLSSIYKPRLDEHDEQIEEALVLGTASGSIASFTDGSTLPMRKLEVEIEPVQSGSGEPSPTNVRPISGWDECNVSVVGKNLSKSQVNNSVLCSVKKGVTYTLSFDGNVGANIKKNTNSGEVVIWGPQLPLTFTADEDFNLFLNAWNANISNIQVEVGNQATEYKPYNGTTYTIDLDGTRYGGTLDVVSGALTVDRVGVDLSSVSFTYDSNNKRWNRQFSDMKNYSARSADLMFEQYQATTSAYTGDTGTAFAYGKDIYIYDANQSLTISGKCIYELATPQTIQLTPTEVKSLLATNNVFADTGDILDATYVRNANITINDLIRRIENLENA